MFALFVLSAFVPVAVLTVLSYAHVRALDTEHARRQLALESSNFARGVYERLLGARLILGVKTAGLRARIDATGADNLDTQQVFRKVYLVTGATVSTQVGEPPIGLLPRIDPRMKAHLAKGESALLPQQGPLRDRTMLVAAIDPTKLERGVLVAEIEPAYLWGDKEELSYQTQACVLDAMPKVLFCTDDKVRDIASSAAGKGEAVKAGGAGEWQYVSRGLFLRARFDAEDWSVVTFRPNAGVAATLARVTYTFLGVIVLTLLFVTFLSVVQIRRTLVPLERLIEGTRRIAREMFEEPVPVERDDEFGQLATSLNSMATRLGRQMGTLRALSEVDQEILSRVDMTQIIDSVQERLQKLWPGAVTGVVVFDQHAADFGIVHLDSGKSGVTAKMPTKIEPWLLSRLARNYDGAWFDVGGSEMPDFLSMVAESGAKRILILPIFWRDKVNGMLVLGLLEPREFDAELISQARDLGNRVGVALAVQTREEALKYRAYHDDLTGLPNRSLMVERLGQEMAHARRNRSQLALIFMDLDRFKSINDSMGHAGGDRLLCEVAERLNACTREGDTVARIGGDEFVVLLPGLDNPQQAARLAGEMLRLLSDPFMINGDENFIGASIGVSLFPVDGTIATELIKKADMAMYRAKALGGGRVIFFEESMNVVPHEQALLAQELRQAPARKQFSIHYRPRGALADGHLSGAEAVLTWHHPDLGWVATEKFMPLAAEIGLADEIGLWMLGKVCAQLGEWRAGDLGVVPVSVKASARQLKSGQLTQHVMRLLRATRALPEALEIGVTQDTLIDDVETVIDQLNRLKQAGVRIALDGFGTGNASFTHLQRLPLDVLKIGPSLIKDMDHDKAAGSMVYSIITLAHALGKSVVADGVETVRQVNRLRSWDCGQIQGHYYSRPVTAPELEEMMRFSRPVDPN